MIKGVKFVSVPVRNQDRSLEFFTEKLGFRVHTDQPFDDRQRWIELAIPGADTKLVLFTMEGHEDRIGGFFNGSFYSNDVDKTFDQLKTKGVEFIHPPKKEGWGTSALFKDPDENVFVISSK